MFFDLLENLHFRPEKKTTRNLFKSLSLSVSHSENIFGKRFFKNEVFSSAQAEAGLVPEQCTLKLSPPHAELRMHRPKAGRRDGKKMKKERNISDLSDLMEGIE